MTNLGARSAAPDGAAPRAGPGAEPILARGGFDACYIALHPFVAVDGLDPADCDHGTLVLDRRDVPPGADLVEWADAAHGARRAGKALDHEAVDLEMKRGGTSVGWAKIAATADFRDHRAVCRALRTHIGGLRPELADVAGAIRLRAHCRRSRLFLPTESGFQPVMERALVALFAACDLDRVVLADEFGDASEIAPLTDLPDDRPWYRRDPAPRFVVQRLAAPDGSLMAYVPWDEFFTVILGTHARMSLARPDRRFEGFWATGETSEGWLWEPALPLVRPGSNEEPGT